MDKNAKPGGHWNFAYQFIKLHQPAQYYGVNSKDLGEGRANQNWNQIVFLIVY